MQFLLEQESKSGSRGPHASDGYLGASITYLLRARYGVSDLVDNITCGPTALIDTFVMMMDFAKLTHQNVTYNRARVDQYCKVSR